jgi:hypothetical protein
MITDYATAIDTTICALDPVNTLKLAANRKRPAMAPRGVPTRDQTVIGAQR